MQQTLGKPWRAMILKDNDGDVGIALAKWEGVVAGKPGVKGVPGKFWRIKSPKEQKHSLNISLLVPSSFIGRSKEQTGVAGTPGVKGDPGHFELTYLNLRSGKVNKITLPAGEEESRRFQCLLGESRAVADLANGEIIVR